MIFFNSISRSCILSLGIYCSALPPPPPRCKDSSHINLSLLCRWHIVNGWIFAQRKEHSKKEKYELCISVPITCICNLQALHRFFSLNQVRFAVHIAWIRAWPQLRIDWRTAQIPQWHLSQFPSSPTATRFSLGTSQGPKEKQLNVWNHFITLKKREIRTNGKGIPGYLWISRYIRSRNHLLRLVLQLQTSFQHKSSWKEKIGLRDAWSHLIIDPSSSMQESYSLEMFCWHGYNKHQERFTWWFWDRTRASKSWLSWPIP